MTRAIMDFHFRERSWWLFVIIPLVIYIAVDRRAPNEVIKSCPEFKNVEVEQ